VSKEISFEEKITINQIIKAINETKVAQTTGFIKDVDLS
jgi:hypothetical protein